MAKVKYTAISDGDYFFDDYPDLVWKTGESYEAFDDGKTLVIASEYGQFNLINKSRQWMFDNFRFESTESPSEAAADHGPKGEDNA